MKSNKSLIIIIIILLISLFASLFLVFRTTIFVNKATVNNSSPVVLENSYLFASPLQAKAGDKSLPADRWEQVRITVFILDGRGLGVPNQNVSLNLPSNVVVNKIQSTTDDSGKAVFDLSSAVAATHNISASVNNKSVPQKVKVTFY